MARLLVRADDLPAGHLRRSSDCPPSCVTPAGGKLFRPTRPPRLTTRPAAEPQATGEQHMGAQLDPLYRLKRPILRMTATWAWSKSETVRRRYAAGTKPTLAPFDAFPDRVLHALRATAASAGLDHDINATVPRSLTIRGLFRRCARPPAGASSRPASCSTTPLRADDRTSRQRSIATVLINEASFEELVNAHTEDAFTWRQIARAARCHGTVALVADLPDQRLHDASLRSRRTDGEPDASRRPPQLGLWAAKRSFVHPIPPKRFGRSIPPHLGGGTILAARWKHRISTDIDVLLPGRNTLIDLLQDNDCNIVNRLGGTP